MGNCAVTQQAVTSWADDGEWDLSQTAEEVGAAAAAGTTTSGAEVTIRITRRQLHELMDRRAGGVPKSRRAAAELLADVMNAGQVYYHMQHCRAAHWKPALQSIPEVVES